jgi:hypothetical protein
VGGVEMPCHREIKADGAPVRQGSDAVAHGSEQCAPVGGGQVRVASPYKNGLNGPRLDGLVCSCSVQSRAPSLLQVRRTSMARRVPRG